MPEYLKYRDRGYMYSPNSTFIPFFREVDECIREVVNQKGLQEHKDDLIKVIRHIKINCCIILFKFYRQHMQLLQNKYSYTKHLSQLMPPENDLATDNVYQDMVRKLCNIRIQEFLSSLK